MNSASDSQTRGTRRLHEQPWQCAAGLPNAASPLNVVFRKQRSIGDGAFRDCSGLTSMMLPASVTSIGDEVWRGCSSLTSISVPESSATFSSLGGVIFNKDRSYLIQYPPGKSGEYNIPDNTTSLRTHAFSWCEYLTRFPIHRLCL